ncbi:hypothetical protein BBJ28_00026156 [Nothophytophthora sp. Chile5]|nr:hypothetical protein BBJ28_00026156 [Nothophytophthora sp. Chile5]
MEPLLPSTSNLEDHGTTDAVTVATLRHYGATVRDDESVDSSHIRATSRRNRRSSLPAAFTSSPELRTRRLRLAIMGGAVVLLVVAILALVSAHQAPVYDEALTSASAVFPWASAASPPSQIHVSLADDTTTVGKRVGMTISWATDKKTTNSSVRYGQKRDALSATAVADAPCEQYEFCLYTSAWFHHVTISGDALLPDTTYYCT